MNKKIIEIIPQLQSGGAERFIVDLSNKLSESNEITLLVLFPLSKDWFYLRELSKNIKVKSLNKRKLGFDLIMFIKLYKFIKNIRPQVVHLHLRSINYILLSILLLRKVSFFYTIHNDAIVDSGGKISRLFRKLLFRYKLVTPITISGESLFSFQKAFSLTAPLIYNGRVLSNLPDSSVVKNEIDSLKKTPNTFVFVNVASIQPSKNQIMLAKVMKRLSDEGFDIILLLIGRVVFADMEKAILDLHCDCIHILREKEEPRLYMSEADAFCLSSLYEGMPISIIEAFSVGLVPICTPVGGIINMIINNENGLLSDDVSEDSFYRTLKKFISLNDIEKKFLSKNAKKSFDKYTISRCTKEYESLFEKSFK